MASVTRIPHRRGGLCGLLLILLGAWGGLVPFVGPYFHFAFTPDRAWAYNSGRLYLSIVPGAAALLGGLVVMITRSRAAGMAGGLLAALGGAWFIVGQGFLTSVLHHPSITAGTPVLRDGTVVSGTTAGWQFAELIGFFAGVGILVIFAGALAIGRFSLVSHRDLAQEADEFGDTDDDSFLSASPGTEPAAQAYATTGAFPAGGSRPFPGEEDTQAQEGYPAPGTSQFRSATGRFPSSS